LGEEKEKLTMECSSTEKNRLIAEHSLWGENGPIMEHYERGGELTFILLQWMAE
jgi:hypothetical protein